MSRALHLVRHINESHEKAFAALVHLSNKCMLMLTIGLTYLTFYAIAVYSIVKTLFGDTDKHRNALLS